MEFFQKAKDVANYKKEWFLDWFHEIEIIEWLLLKMYKKTFFNPKNQINLGKYRKLYPKMEQIGRKV